MPIFEYVCQECQTKYDKFVRSRQAKLELECPECGSPRAEKAFSAFSTGRTSRSTSGGIANSAPACGPIG